MDIKQLNYFIQIADCGSYSLASQKMYISQPALSKVIKNMEDEMGFTFFYTYQRKQKLTDAGQVFYEKAKKLLENYNNLIQTTYSEVCIDKGHLRIGLSMAGGAAMFAHIFSSFREEYPQITFSVLERETSILKEEVLKKNLDLAYIDMRHFLEEDKEDFDFMELLKCENVLIASVDNPILQKDFVVYEDLAEQSILLYNGGKTSASSIELEMKKRGMTPNTSIISTQWNFIADLAAAGMGVAVCPFYIYNKFKNPKIGYTRLRPDIGGRCVGIITRKNEYKTRACTCFIDYISNLEHYDGLIEQMVTPETLAEEK